MCIVHGCTYVPQPGSYVYTLCGEQTKQNRERETGCNELFVNTENVSGGREAGGIVNNPTPVGKHLPVVQHGRDLIEVYTDPGPIHKSGLTHLFPVHYISSVACEV